MKSLSVALIAAVSLTAMWSPASAQVKPGMPGYRDPASNIVNLKVCNHSGRDATVAVSYVPPGESSFMNRGWFDVADGACRDLVETDNTNFYFYADANDGSGRYWEGSHSLCVEYPGPYTFYTTGSEYCEDYQEVRNFTAFTADNPGDWTWTLDP